MKTFIIMWVIIYHWVLKDGNSVLGFIKDETLTMVYNCVMRCDKGIKKHRISK